MNFGRLLACAAVALLASCSGFSNLTPQILNDSKLKWTASRPAAYSLVVTMGGDRLPVSEYAVRVDKGRVISLKRDGKDVNVSEGAQGEDYSMDGLLNILDQEMQLAEQEPGKLGAAAGYKVYLMAQFAANGRLLKYRRTVGGGVNNTIDIVVQSFEPL